MKKLNELKLEDKKYIIFDMDGTLIDSIGVWNVTDQNLIKEYGQIMIDLNTIQMDRDNFLHANQDSDIYLAYCKYLIDKYNLSIYDAKKLLQIRQQKSGKVLEEEIDFKPYVVELITNLKRIGLTLILATMTTQVQLDIYSKKNNRMLKQMNIEKVFDLIVKKEDVKNKKPNPEIYDKILEYYNAFPEECLIFEDSYVGVLASKNARMECVNVYDRYSDLDREKINDITDYFIECYEELLPLVKSLRYKKLKKIN